MIKAYTLATAEIDSAELAQAEMLEQLGKVHLLANSVGIMTCHYDFIYSGVVATVCGALPFPVVGFTTFSQVTDKAEGLFEMSVMVLTSDDVAFGVAKGPKAAGDAPLDDTWRSACAGQSGPPALAMAFLGLGLPYSGDAFLRRLDAAGGGVPCFGAVAAGEDEAGGNVFVLYEGEAFTDTFVLLLLFGPARARYYTGSYLHSHLLEYSGVVTKTADRRLLEVDGHPTVDFLKRNGFEPIPGEAGSLRTIPFMYKASGEDAMVARTMSGLDEAGNGILMAEVPKGATFYTGVTSAPDLLEVTGEVTRRAVEENPDAALFLMFSCVGRYITLGLEVTSEMDCVKRLVAGRGTYLMAYGSGEICPLESKGKWGNYFHNGSFIVCAIG